MPSYIECENESCKYKNYHYQGQPKCERCGESLEGIRPQDDGVDSQHSASKPAPQDQQDTVRGKSESSTAGSPGKYRLCPNSRCQHRNTHNRMECEKCGLSLEDVIWREEEATAPETPPAGESAEQGATAGKTTGLTRLKLVSALDGRELEIPVLGGMLGREGDIMPQYFRSLDPQSFISRQHAQIKLKGTQYVLMDNNSHNGTELNSQRLQAMREYVLSIGDTITLADREFIAKTGS